MSLDKTPSANQSGAVSSKKMNEKGGGASSSASPSSSESHNPNSQTVSVMKKNRSDVIKTIQEIAKVDEFTINQAIEACQDSEGRYSMDQVLNILMDENSVEQQNQQQENQAVRNSLGKQGNSGTLPSPQNANDDKSSKSRGSVGYTSSNERTNEYGSESTNLDIDDEDDDFDTINLQSNTSVNQFSNTMLNSSVTCKSTGHLTELNMLRENGKPPGLKNVGNTCWFNSIIQAFFHLPYLRELILSFQVNEKDFNKLDENSKNVVQFVLELRKLFTLMLRSKRKSINPNPTLKCLRNCSKYDVDLFNQEDVSEFATILVNLIEESFDIMFKLHQQEIGSSETDSMSEQNFKSTTDTIIPIQIQSSSLSTTSSVYNIPEPTERANLMNASLRIKNRKNPIVKLLNGDLLINRKKSDEGVTNSLVEIFREVNIQMLNARNLHAGLELEWGETSIDKLTTPNNSSTNTQQSKCQIDTDPLNKSMYQQESWIIQLPSVLFVCLNRYKFVKATQSSSKIMEPFEFEQSIYLDRYLYKNRDVVKFKRKELQTLTCDLKKLEEKLDSIKSYKSNDNKNNYALDDVLKCALDFATTDYSLNEIFNSIKPTIKAEETNPELIKEAEKVEIVKDCLQNWVEKVKDKIEILKVNIEDIKSKIENIFDSNDLKKTKYNLHSVCIHEGNAMSGHFWTYIWNTQQLKWFKLNDTEVTESNWDDLYSNAIGGNSVYKNEKLEAKANFSEIKTEIGIGKVSQPSAYFLIYVKADDESLYEEKNLIYPDLQRIIEDDHEHLKTQIINLRLKKLYRECVETLKKSNTLILEANQNSNNPVNDQNNQTCIEHAKAFKESIIDCFTMCFAKITSNKNLNAAFGGGVAPIITLENSGVQDALNKAIEIELNKYTETSRDINNKLPDNDLRIHHILTYLSCNNVPNEIKVIALYDLFRVQIFAENNIKLKLIQILSQIKFNEYVLASLNNGANAVDQSASSSSTPSSTGAHSMTDLYKIYEKWQNDYRDFRSIIAAFINASNFMESEKYEEAATFFCVACEYNERITSNLNNKMKGMDHDFLLLNRRKCLKLWNQSVIRKFSRSTVNYPMNTMNTHVQQAQPLNQQEMTGLIELMISKFLPCFFRLGNPNSSVEDKAMIDEIRQDWLGVLDSNLPELQVFHDFMAKLFEDQFVNHFHSLNVNKTMLIVRYKEAVQLLKKIRIN